jgi:energy-coupling factor transporter ATP-binding protein EcfA2
LGATTILLYGRSNSGKSTQIGVMAEHVMKTTGKKTRLYTADKGGVDPIQPYINLGIIDAIEMGDTDPFIFLNRACNGYVRDDKGKWVKDDSLNAEVGCYAFESMRGFAEALMATMGKKASEGTSIGGGANIAFQVQSDDVTLKVSGSNMAMFGVAQAKMTEEIWASQRLNAQYILWTSSVSKDEDGVSSGKVLGPDVIGKALTAEVPRWFHYSFRIDVLPAQGGKGERHILYLGSHVDINAGNAAGLGNIRRPLDAPALTQTTVEPANIVTALQLVRDASINAAQEAIKKRMAMK